MVESTCQFDIFKIYCFSTRPIVHPISRSFTDISCLVAIPDVCLVARLKLVPASRDDLLPQT